jgi:hypothetical protein
MQEMAVRWWDVVGGGDLDGMEILPETHGKIRPIGLTWNLNSLFQYRALACIFHVVQVLHYFSLASSHTEQILPCTIDDSIWLQVLFRGIFHKATLGQRPL